MFDQLPDLRFKLPVIIPEYSRIAESTYTQVIPLMMQFLVLKCVSTYTQGRLIHEYIWYFPENLGAMSEEQGERLRVKSRYQNHGKTIPRSVEC